MKRINSHCIGVDQGSTILFSDFEHGGEMWAGSGARSTRSTVTFSQPFTAAPSVHVSISMWDLDQKTNFRADISSEDVTETGFVILFKTWGDTRVARIRADWTAIGPLRHEDDWDLG